MNYKSGEVAEVGDKVLGDKVKGHVSKLLDKEVEVRSAGPWDPKSKPSEVRAPYDPATLVLAHRYPKKASGKK